MSISIYWEPSPPPRRERLDVGAPSKFMECLRSLAPDELVLGPEHYGALRALAMLWGPQESPKNPFLFLVEQITEFGAVRITADP